MDWERFNTFRKEIKNKNVLIVGLGLQGGGVGATKFFHELGANLRITDLKTEDALSASLKMISPLPIDKFTFGKHEHGDVDWADLILLNPDIPKGAPVLKYAINKRKQIQMEEALFAKLCPVRDLIGITGTRGKTTTTFLTYELLKTQFPAMIAGNIPGSETLMNLFQIEQETIKIVLELSSFQLYGFRLNRISPHVAVITNIYEDHLNKYPSMKEYTGDKKAIYLYQNDKDYLILNKSIKMASEAISKRIIFGAEDVEQYQLRLRGKHNAENYAASLQTAKLFNITAENVKKIFRSFAGVPFRQEVIRVVNGITFVNDTTASTPVAAIKALEAFAGKKVILICGGFDKKLNFEEFARRAAQTCKKIIFLAGSATENFRRKVLFWSKGNENVGRIYSNFIQALDMAYGLAENGDVVLLSPGFASFGMFKNEFDRGRQFNEYVKRI